VSRRVAKIGGSSEGHRSQSSPTTFDKITGSQTAIALLEANYSVTIVDNLSNSFASVIDHIKRVAGDKSFNVSFINVSQMRRPTLH
jgi:hypothetical protein